MQTAKAVAASAKETVSNIGASAQSGMDKTKATAQEKVERITAHDPMEKQMATQRKEEKINQAEMNKQQIYEYNAEAKQQYGGATGGTVGGTTGGHSHLPGQTVGTGQATGLHQMSALPGHGGGQPSGQVVEGTGVAHPVGSSPGTGRSVATNPRAGGESNQGYGTGGSLS